MPTLILIVIPGVLFCTWGFAAHAQDFAEWWQQKKTRIQYLEQQTAALETLKNTTEEGYGIAEDGIREIEDRQEEELHLHYSYFNSLEILHTVIKNNPEASAICALYACLFLEMTHLLSDWGLSPWLHPEEFVSVVTDFTYVRNSLSKDLDLLDELMEEGPYKMTDGERLTTLQEIRKNADKSYAFVSWRKETTNILIEERRDEAGDTNTLKTFFP